MIINGYTEESSRSPIRTSFGPLGRRFNVSTEVPPLNCWTGNISTAVGLQVHLTLGSTGGLVLCVYHESG